MMKVNSSHRLINEDDNAVPFVSTTNKGGTLSGGKPKFLIIHYTAGGSAEGAIRWFQTAGANASAHLVIAKSGAITQMVPFNTVGWHAGRSTWKTINGLNAHSVGIEIVNWGLLFGAPGNWKSWTGAAVPDGRVMQAKHKNFEPNRVHAWEIFDEDQLNATVAAAAAIITKYNIPEESVLGHDDISPVRKQDPGPAFPMELFKSLVFGRSEVEGAVMKVSSATGLNLRTGPGINFDVVENLEDGRRVVPMGRDGAWWEVTTLNAAGEQDKTGWVHGNWLVNA
jgi:N-acetylmuramoyl-L-alanine amidase